jgi:hypothetical protein
MSLKTRTNLNNDHPGEIPGNPRKPQKQPTGIPPVGSKSPVFGFISALPEIPASLNVLIRYQTTNQRAFPNHPEIPPSPSKRTKS